MSSIRAHALSAVVLLSAALPAAAQCDGIPDCVPVWSDEFDGSAVDRSKWSFQIGDGTGFGLPSGWGNNELQYYRAENAAVAGGFLTLTAREEPFGGKAYTSARIRSLGKGDWTYGRMEMRARMPVGRGLWPAFWMLPSDSLYGGWAASGEIDIIEYLGHQPDRILGTLHYGGSWPYNLYTSTSYYLPVGTFHDDFHLFALEWEPGAIRWYVDDVLYSTRTSWFSRNAPFPAPFDADFHLLLNLAVGGNLPGPPGSLTTFPQELVVDYVRVYQRPSGVSIASPTSGAVLRPGDPVTIEAETDDGASIERVEFLQGKAVLGEDTTPPFQWHVPRVAAGCYSVRARAWDADGTARTSTPVNVTVGSGCPQAPYRMTPATLPGTIETEDFDLGGAGVSYHDADANNRGGAYRPGEEVDLERSTDVGAGFNIGWTTPGEWLEYTVDVLPGTYDAEIRVASLDGGGTLHLEIDGVDVSGPVPIAATGGWQSWTTVRVEGLTLHAGVQTMRVVMDTGGFNLNRIAVVEPPDTDGDGVADGDDACPRSDLAPTVVIDGCDSGTPNLLGPEGCSFSDGIAAAASAATNHGEFVSAVARLMDSAKTARRIRGDQRGAVMSCAARADLPESASPAGVAGLLEVQIVDDDLAGQERTRAVRRIPKAEDREPR